MPVGQLAADSVLLALPEPMTIPKVENLRLISKLPHSGHFTSLSLSERFCRISVSLPHFWHSYSYNGTFIISFHDGLVMSYRQQDDLPARIPVLQHHLPRLTPSLQVRFIFLRCSRLFNLRAAICISACRRRRLFLNSCIDGTGMGFKPVPTATTAPLGHALTQL